MRFISLIFALLLLSQPAWAARLHTSGFETNNLTETEWSSPTAAGGTRAAISTGCHSGTYCFESAQGGTTGNNVIQYGLVGAVTSGTQSLRVAFKLVTEPNAFPHTIACFRNSAGAATGGGPVELRLTKSGSDYFIDTFNTLTSITYSGTIAFASGTWIVIQQKVVIADSPNGSIETRINGVVDAGASATGIDTLDGTNGMRGINIGGQGTPAARSGYDYIFDDVALNDATGTFETGYPRNDAIISLMKPTSDNSVTWTKTGANCSGTTNTDCVDDEPGAPDDVSGYNTSSTANNEDRFNLTALPAEVAANNTMIVADLYDRWDGNGTTGTRQGRNLIWDNSSNQTNGATHTRCDIAAGNWTIAAGANSAAHTPYNLAAFTKANVNSFTIGYEPLNNAECRVTAIWLNVESAPVPACGGSSSIALMGVGCR
jgi:hypothetical protein